MTLRNRFHAGTVDDRAVSPVIGVILMVAITVILAAVIGTFVLDLGQSAGQSAPQASLSVSANPNGGATGTLTIEHTGGDAIDQASTRIIIENSSGQNVYASASSSGLLSVGGKVTIDVGAGSPVGSPWGGMTEESADLAGISSGNQYTVTLIDTDSQRQIFETTVTA